MYAFGLEDFTYDGNGNLTTSTYYSNLGGQLIAELSGPPNAQTTNLFMTDALGSVLALAAFSNTAGVGSRREMALFLVSAILARIPCID